MNETIPPSKKALAEALALSLGILKNIELSELPLENIALKNCRLARLVNDYLVQKIMEYEVSGYPSTPNGLPQDIYELAVIAGREYELEDSAKKTDEQQHQNVKLTQKYVYCNSIRQLEENIKHNELAIMAAKDPDISISSANPQQFIHIPTGNSMERTSINTNLFHMAGRLASRRSFIYHYALKKHYELKFSGIADDIFTRIRYRVDSCIGDMLPESVKKFNAIYDILQSDNSEDWSNAVHRCRRILEDLANIVFPPTTSVHKSGKTYKLGQENYINRLIAYVDDSSNSDRYKHLVGSNISFFGDRLDSIFKAAQKGSHSEILTVEEADRYVVNTYLIVGDILSLWMEQNSRNKQ